MRKVCLAAFVLFSGLLLSAEEKSGKIEGLLVEKGEKFVRVIADGQEESVKYIPEWHGGMPKDGGGLDKKTLAKIKKLYVPNRVLLTWKFEEHNRILDIKILEPRKKSGVIKGKVLSTADKKLKVLVEVKGEKRIEIFSPRWIGGMPKKGGGLDKEILKELKKYKEGDKVAVKWVYDERKRVVGIKSL